MPDLEKRLSIAARFAISGVSTIRWGSSRQPATLRSVNAVRGALLLVLIIVQSMEVSETYGSSAAALVWPFSSWIPGALFALAGFTALRSVERHGRKLAFARAGARLLPALLLVVVFSALALGAVSSVGSWRAYITDSDVPRYLLSLIGDPQFTLPGVFEFNPAAGIVNEVLWAIPAAYISAAVLVMATVKRKWTAWLLGGAALILAAVSIGLSLANVDLGVSGGVVAQIFGGQALQSLLCFVIGAMAFALRRFVPMDWKIAAGFALILLVLLDLGNRTWAAEPLFNVGAAVPVTYLALFACSWPWPWRHVAPKVEPIFWRLFLCSFPVQQLWIAIGPDRQSGALNLLLSLPGIILLSVAEAFLIERPLFRRIAPNLWNKVEEFASPRRRLRSREVAAQVRRAGFTMLGVLLIVVAVLAALAIAMLAMQRDPGGA